MIYQEALNYLYNLEGKGQKFRLANIRALLRLLGNPHHLLKAIHIGGTNGKGSTAAFISSILQAGGYKVGLYTSPHLWCLRERIAINNVPISPRKLTKLVALVKPLIKKVGWLPGKNQPTFFETVTALAFLFFAKEKVDFLVCEVGIGGRLDATNVLQPLVSVITNIDFEHKDKLGETIAQIAREKAGIVKRKGVVITASKKREALSVIEEICRRKETRLFRVGKDIRWRPVKSSLRGETFQVVGIYSYYPSLTIPLIGDHQIENASTAMAAVEALGMSGIFIPPEAVKEGLAKTSWPGRFEIVRKSPLIILDGAHNPAAAKVLKETLVNLSHRNSFSISLPPEGNYRSLSPGGREGSLPTAGRGEGVNLILILGILNDKDISGIVKELVPLAREVVVTRPQTERAMEPDDLAREVRRYTPNVTVRRRVKNALSYALKQASTEDTILLAGSIYLVGEARKQVNKDTNLDRTGALNNMQPIGYD